MIERLFHDGVADLPNDLVRKLRGSVSVRLVGIPSNAARRDDEEGNENRREVCIERRPLERVHELSRAHARSLNGARLPRRDPAEKSLSACA